MSLMCLESIINDFVVSTQVARHMAQGACKGPDLQRSRCRHRHAGPSGGGAGKA